LSRAAPPPEIVEAARRRSAAREAHDWAPADQLRAEIEAAGWRVIDSGTKFRLEAEHPPEVVTGGVVRYGRSEAVPSRFDEPHTGEATVVIVAEADAAEVIRAVAAVRRGSPAGISLVVVANGMASAAEAEVERAAAGLAGAAGAPQAAGEPRAATPEGEGSFAPGVAPESAGTYGFELVRTSARLGRATALNIGLRRSTGSIVILLDPAIEAEGDVITPLIRALDDPGVAVAGPLGLASGDLRRFDQVIAPGPDPLPVAAIEGGMMAFRRADAAVRGPLDEGFKVAQNLDAWWSLVLRDGGEGQPSRRALAIPELPLRRHEAIAATPARAAEQERLAKRSSYRVLDRFGRRMDLAVPVE
jgi:hypothetical protein